jgi:hypothetical protein
MTASILVARYGAEALCLSIQAVLEAAGFAQQMGQAAQTIVVIAVGPIAVAHQPAVDDGAEHAVQELLGASPDREDSRRGGGAYPQPKQAPLLFPTGLVGMEQVTVADLGEQLLLNHRLGGAGGLVQALVAGRHTEPQAEPVVEKLLDAPAREAYAQQQGADQGHQQRPDQVALVERDAPQRIIGAVSGLGAGPVPTLTQALMVDLLGLDDLQPGAIRRERTQIDHQAGAVGALGVGRRQGAPTDGRGIGVVMAFVIDRQALRAPMPRCAGALPGTALLLRFARLGALLRAIFARIGFLLPLFILFIVRSVFLLVPIRRFLARLVCLATFPRRLATRWTRAVARALVKTLVRRLQIGKELYRQGAQPLFAQPQEVGFVELGKVVSGKLHVVVRSIPASAPALPSIST